MAKADVSNKFLTKDDVEKFLKSNKSFMNNHSAAEFDAYVDGAMFMLKEKDLYIAKLKERVKRDSEKVLELENELAPFKEMYADYDFVQKRTKKTKKKVVVEEEDDEDYESELPEDDEYIDDSNQLLDEDDEY